MARPCRPHGWPAFVCGLLCAALGCSSSGLLPVSGTASLDGEPLEAGSVTFHPDASKGNTSQHVPAGLISKGRYELYTNGKRGAPPGAYKVTLVVDDFSGGKAPPKNATAQAPQSLIPARYNDPRTTPLTAQVTARPASGAYDLSITQKGP